MKPFVPKRNSGTSFYRTYEGLKPKKIGVSQAALSASFYRTYEGLKPNLADDIQDDLLVFIVPMRD